MNLNVIMPFKKKSREYELVKEAQDNILKVDATSWNYLPSIENNPLVMAYVIDLLVEFPNVTRIVFNQRKVYTYNYDQTQMLTEISNLYNHLVKQKRLLNLGLLEQEKYLNQYYGHWRVVLQRIVLTLLKQDPIGAYVELLRELREEKINVERTDNPQEIVVRNSYIELLNYLKKLFDSTKLIALTKASIAGYEIGQDRSLYRQFLNPDITPDFIYTRLMATPPIDAEELDVYKLDKDTEVNILKVQGDIKYLYHVSPPEFKISEDKYEILDLARQALIEHKPTQEEFTNPEKMRQTFFNIGRDLIQELAEYRGLELTFNEIQQLAEILVRYTVGFGLIEVLLKDQKIQDITINGPIGQSPIFIVHQDYDDCVTNLTPSLEDGESWASKFRLISGRPLDEANPVLDTELLLKDARARVAIINKPLNPYGLAFALRRHRDNPWTYPLFMQNKMMNPLAAGLLSFLVDGARTILFAGTRSSGKTSLLGSTLVEIMRKYRMIVVEDSVTGDCELLIKKDGKITKTTIGELIDSAIKKYGCWYSLTESEILGNDEGIEVLSKNKENKFVWGKPSKLIRHKVNKKIYEIKTRTGRTIKVTEDHSLFTLNDSGEIKEIKPAELKNGSHIVTPRVLPFGDKDLKSINLFDHLDKINKGFIYGNSLKSFIEQNYFEIKQFAKEHKYSKSTPSNWLRKGLLPIKILKDLNSLDYKLKQENDLYFSISSTSSKIPFEIELDKLLLILFGIWLADGCYDKRSIIFSTFDDEDREIVKKVANKFNLEPKMHSDGGSYMVNSTTLKFIFKEIFELKGDAHTKKIPNWIFGLSKEQMSNVLKGIFSGDGHVGEHEITMPLCSLQLLKDIQTLLLGFKINLRIGNKRKDNTYSSGISTVNNWINFRENINFLQKYKKEKLDSLSSKKSSHDNTDIIPISKNFREEIYNLFKNSKIFSYNDYVIRDNNLGRQKLNRLLLQSTLNHPIIEKLKLLSSSDIFWDEVTFINQLHVNDIYVYDLSVPENENFVCNNILAHNTQEIPIDALRKLGYNIQGMKVRSALTHTSSELGADEGIRTSLRLGDSSLIVGEIRSLEAPALYEAMRIGALANVVAGTIHGADPYSVYDRVVNDLNVPKTSFKATDIIVVSNPVKTADGLHKSRRILQITEVRKHWQDDPLRENGFVDLMSYNPKDDTLKPSQDLLNGDSEILKSIASNVKEYSGNWDAIWDNILLRARIKESLLSYSIKTRIPEILESKFTVQSNDIFHQISDNIREEVGFIESKRVFYDWNEWVKEAIKKKQF